jgi:hypothetical protein
VPRGRWACARALQCESRPRSRSAERPQLTPKSRAHREPDTRCSPDKARGHRCVPPSVFQNRGGTRPIECRIAGLWSVIAAFLCVVSCSKQVRSGPSPGGRWIRTSGSSKTARPWSSRLIRRCAESLIESPPDILIGHPARMALQSPTSRSISSGRRPEFLAYLGAELKVRIHFPPAGSQLRTGLSGRTLPGYGLIGTHHAASAGPERRSRGWC